MYHTRKIGIFISHIFGHYQQSVCQGIIDKSQEYGYTTEFFASMDGEDLGSYEIGEKSILRIPNFDGLDGVIFVSGTYLSLELKMRILTALKSKCTCPVIEISDQEQYFPSVTIENNTTTGELTEHFITEHHYERICYLGCSTESYFSDLRKHYFCETLKKHGREVSSHDIYACDYSSNSVAKALEFFEKTGKPDAVVCYNDRMALSFMRAVLSSGYQIPQDIAITGCDNTPDGRNATPMLTTVTFPCYDLGTTAFEQLLQLIQGKSVPATTTIHARPIIANSCGCNKQTEINPVFLSHTLTQRIAKLEESIFTSMNMSASSQHISDIDEGVELLKNYIHTIEHCKEFYFCLYADWDSVSSHILEITESEELPESNEDTVYLKLAIRDGKRLPECSFKKTSLLPEYIYEHSDCAYIYSPLFFEEKEFGYIALAYENNRIEYHFRLIQWLMDINQMLQGICEVKRTNLLVKHLENFYMRDALTGLYNKHGYNHEESSLLERAQTEHVPLTCFIFDMDNLKMINDNFGHREGDFALQVIAHALENATHADDICARFSGDEFYLLTCGYSVQAADDLITNVQKYLDNYNRLSARKYTISVSGGYASAIPDPNFSVANIQELFSQADEKMYQKKKKKHGRSS